MSRDLFHVVIYRGDEQPYIKSSHNSRAAAKQVAAAFSEPHAVAQIERHMVVYRRPATWAQGALQFGETA